MKVSRNKGLFTGANPLVKTDYIGRIIQYPLFLSAGISVLIPLEVERLYIILFATKCILWPHIAFLAARFARDQRNFELKYNLNLDCLIFCPWIPLTQLNPFMVLLVIIAAGSPGIVVGGVKLFASRLVSLVIGIGIGILIFGFRYNPDTSMVTIVIVSISLAVFVFTSNFIFYNANITLSRIRKELKDQNSMLEGLGNSLRKYLPHQLVSSIMDGKVAACNETERKKLTIFFSDIKAFTDTTDSLEAEELSTLLNEYLTEMTKIAAKYGGTIDKFIGDAVMIFFGAPESSGEKEDALRCVRMAVEMQARMKELRDKWFNQGFERPLEIRIGINTGVATVGDFGAEERLSYTTIGGQVNIASRLESMCEPGKILISHATWALVKDEFRCSPKGAAQVKGIHHDVLVYEVVAS